MQLIIMIAAVLLWSCHAQSPSTRPHDAAATRWFSGMIVRSNGEPVGDAIVTVTDLRTHNRLATMRTDSKGVFGMSLAATNVALTATSNGTSVYVPNIGTDRESLPIILGTDCAMFHGHIDVIGRVPNDMIIYMNRISDNDGDAFGVTLKQDGTFHVCVPPALYILELPATFAERPNFEFVPGSPLSFRITTTAEVDKTLNSMYDIVPESREFFGGAISSRTRVFGIGESNHGTRQFSDERTQLAIEMARKNAFSLVMIEAGFGETLLLDDFINGAKIDVRSALANLGYWPWDTETFLESLEALRVYNVGLPQQHRLHMVGFDIQTTKGAIDFLSKAYPEILSVDVASTFSKLAEADGKQWPSLSSDDRARAREILERLAQTKPKVGVGIFSIEGKAALSARSLLLRIELLESTTPVQKLVSRDAGMARMVLEVLEMHPSARAILWAHLAHLSREYIIGVRTVGQLLAAKLGDAYQVYAQLAYSGSPRAWDTKSKIGVISHQIPEPPADSLEATLYKRRRGASVTYWSFARATGPGAQWLGGLHRLCEFGAIYPGDRNVFVIWDLRSIDGAILFDNVQPTVPTATGVRMAAPKSQ